MAIIRRQAKEEPKRIPGEILELLEEWAREGHSGEVCIKFSKGDFVSAEERKRFRLTDKGTVPA